MRKKATSSDGVGYGKPPAKTQFKKGRSGNPRGRPKGSRNFATDVKEMLAMPVAVEREGKRRKFVSTQKAVLMRLRQGALNREIKAIDRLVAMAFEHGGDDRAEERDALSEEEQAILDAFQARMLDEPSDASLAANEPQNATPEQSKP